MIYRIYMASMLIVELKEEDEFIYEAFQKTVELARILGKTAFLFNASTGEVVDYFE